MKITVFSKLTLRGRRWFFRIVAANGEIIAQSEAYTRKNAAINTACKLRAGLYTAKFEVEVG
jgi:uncharacterized protein YegP (UPF0339 family)